MRSSHHTSQTRDSVLEGRTFHSLRDMVPTRRGWLGSVARKNKIGRGHLAERQGALAVSLAPVLRSVLLHALQESDSRLCRMLTIVLGIPVLQSHPAYR